MSSSSVSVIQRRLSGLELPRSVIECSQQDVELLTVNVWWVM